MTDLSQLAKSLTKAQLWALEGVARGKAKSPAWFGEYMMERPGAMGDRKTPYKAQGYGRMGGAMMRRLLRMGLVEIHYEDHGHWCPTRATITPLGLALRAHLKGQTDADA